MSVGYGLAAIVLAVALWWFGFIATKQMRLDKNRERMQRWEKMAAAQKIRRQQAEREQATSEQSTSEQSNSEQASMAPQHASTAISEPTSKAQADNT